ncbi:MAG: hypothetical protein GDA56_13260 [Hormoscilla sp. GM7CHS1pb]|nr:hypothetical protein [Hormoscilla sp. GM7CHS1pb]
MTVYKTLYETAIRFNATFAKAHFNLGMTLPHSASRSHPTPGDRAPH